jgi:hypothetical protein
MLIFLATDKRIAAALDENTPVAESGYICKGRKCIMLLHQHDTWRSFIIHIHILHADEVDQFGNDVQTRSTAIIDNALRWISHARDSRTHQSNNGGIEVYFTVSDLQAT